MAKKKNDTEVEVKQDLIAKKDWLILNGKFDKVTQQHEHTIKIKTGDNVSGQPDWVLTVLKTEGVI